jgi:hypothetical protein
VFHDLEEHGSFLYDLGTIRSVRGTFGPNAGKHTQDLLTSRIRPQDYSCALRNTTAWKTGSIHLPQGDRVPSDLGGKGPRCWGKKVRCAIWVRGAMNGGASVVVVTKPPMGESARRRLSLMMPQRRLKCRYQRRDPNLCPGTSSTKPEGVPVGHGARTAHARAAKSHA